MKTETDLRNEEKLLLKLCRIDFSEAHASAIRSDIDGISDWDYFVSLSNIHGVAALVCCNLDKMGLSGRIPAEIMASFRNFRMKTLGRNEFNAMITAEIARLLKMENIPVILLKGMALELMIYGNEGIRQMSDVDILVSREKCIRAREILMDEGFESLPVKSVFHKLILKNIGKHLPSLHKKGVLIELHHELFGDPVNGLTRMFIEKSRETIIKGEKVLVPDEQLLFLYLVRHLWLHEKNNESQLRIYTDLLVLADKFKKSIFNSELPGLAERAGLEEPLASRLMILEKYWGISLPENIRNFVDKFFEREFETIFLFFLRSPKGNLPSDKSWYYRHFVNEIPGFHRKLLFILGDLFPTISFMKRRYKCNSWLKALLYYPHRAGKLLFLFKR